jgi:hypothetical protein
MLRISKLLAAVMALVLLFAVSAFAVHGHFPYTPTVARAERNELQPHMSTLRKLSRALDVDPAELVDD